MVFNLWLSSSLTLRKIAADAAAVAVAMRPQ